MKYISLFVCFFIGLQTLNAPDYERLISNIERHHQQVWVDINQIV